LPTYDWPVAEFPQLQYPFAKYEHENNAEEQRCLEGVRQTIEQRKAESKDVAAIIIEPISSYKNARATPGFYKGLRKLAKEHGIPFIVDETKTGVGATGKMWGQDHWYLNENDGGCADIVTFGGRAGISGFYSTAQFKLHPQCASFAQDVDMVKLLNYEIVWRTIHNRALHELVQDTSSFLKIELGNIERDSGFISNVRGQGTFIGFDTVSNTVANSLQAWLLKGGVQVARVGPQTFGLKPALIMKPKDAAPLRESLKSYHPNHDQH